MTHPLSIADLPHIFWLRSHVYRSYPHIALQTMQTRTKGFAPSPRAPCRSMAVSLRGFPQHAT